MIRLGEKEKMNYITRPAAAKAAAAEKAAAADHDQYWVEMQNCIQSLEQERHKIHVFKRDLPLSLQLVTQAIDSYKQQQLKLLVAAGQCSHEQTNTDSHHHLHLEEFIPVSSSPSFSSSSFHNDQEDQECYYSPRSINFNMSYQTSSYSNSAKKLDWLKSAHLSLGHDQTLDLPPTPIQGYCLMKPSEIENNSIGAAACHPLVKKKLIPAINNKTKPTSNPTDNSQKDDQRKSRRCWSPDLHKRFLDALQNLGGPHVATPKQIREVMKVDGLTNDEVKSHLQKYRLHTRRPIADTNHMDDNDQQRPFVIVGGIWVPQTMSDSMKALPSADPDDTYSSVPKLFASTSSSSYDCRNGDNSSFPTTPNNDQPTTTLLLG